MAVKLSELYVQFSTRGLTTVRRGIGGLHATMKSVNAGAEQLGRHTKRAMLLIGGFAALAIREAVKFEAQLAEVNTMLDKGTDHHLANYEKGLRRLSVSFGESTATLAKGLYDILSASVAPEKAMFVLETASKAAAGGLTDTGTAGDAITTILNAYGMNAARAGEVSDKLFATVKRGKITFGQLAVSIGKVAATGKLAGLGLEELFSMVSTITRAGISADQGMTAIQGTLRSFLKPAAEAKKMFKKFFPNEEMSVATLRAKGLVKILAGLKDATAEQIAVMFPNIRGLKGVAAALGDATGLAKDLALQYRSAGMAQDAFRKRQKTLSFQLGRVKQGFFDVLRAVGEALKPEMRQFGDYLITLTRAITRNADKVAEWIKRLLKLGAKILYVVGVIKLVTVALAAMDAVLASTPLGMLLKIGAAIVMTGVAVRTFNSIIEDAKKGLDGFIESSRTLTDIIDDERAALAESQGNARDLVNELESLVKAGDNSYASHQRLATIVTELTQRYPRLQGVLRGMTGTQKEQTAALERFRKAREKQDATDKRKQRERHLEQARDEILAVRSRMEQVDKALVKYESRTSSARVARDRAAKRVAAHDWSTSSMDIFTDISEYKQADKTLAFEKKRRNKLRKERGQLVARDTAARGIFDRHNQEVQMARELEEAKGKAEKKRKATILDEAAQVAREEAEAKAEERAKNDKEARIAATKAGLELETDKHKRAMALMKIRHQAELEAAKKLIVDIGLIKQKQAFEVAGLEANKKREAEEKEAARKKSAYGRTRQFGDSLLGGLMGMMPEEKRRELEADDWYKRQMNKVASMPKGSVTAEQMEALKAIRKHMKEGGVRGGAFQSLAAISKQAQQAAFKPNSPAMKHLKVAKDMLALHRKWDDEDERGKIARLGA